MIWIFPPNVDTSAWRRPAAAKLLGHAAVRLLTRDEARRIAVNIAKVPDAAGECDACRPHFSLCGFVAKWLSATSSEPNIYITEMILSQPDAPKFGKKVISTHIVGVVQLRRGSQTGIA